MEKRAEKLQRRSYPFVSWLFTLVLLILTIDIGTEMTKNPDGDGWGVMAVCLFGIFLIRRIMGSRIYLSAQEVRVVNPLKTYTVPLRSLRSVTTGGGLKLYTVDGVEIHATAFGGSLVDHFVGTADRAASRIQARIGRPSRKAGAARVSARPTTAWVADACAVGGAACTLTALVMG
ncbi:hypothetical protein [Streptomyces sp. S1]|uniref:hypothetical protein n=1 Tax=Streptomyces sp. S1 TaxID=718288 RepID=UPI003D73B5E4